ncbi:MAG: hypothetical protein HRU09_05290 [Oligoflexales bacterium]|nr:hypothetical protein [Oligoflexales bacterium]
MQTVTFNTLNNLEKMDGSVAKIIGNATLDIDQEQEVLLGANPDEIYLNIGEDVSLNYTVEDDIVHPLNFHSMAMLSIYYNFEKVVEFWRDNLSLDLADFGKRRLFYDPDIAASSAFGSVSGTIKLNAAFLPGVRDFWFFKTSPLERVPFKMNMAIMAHEFSHGVFDYVFANTGAGFYDSDSEIATDQLSGINEGIADYNAWMVTGRESEFVESLEQFAKERTIPVSWNSQDLIDRGTEICTGGFYCKGSVLASALYEVAIQDGFGRVKVGQTVHTAISSFREDWQNNKSDNSFDYHYFLIRVINEAANDSEKLVYCDAFKARFNDETNLSKVNEVCETFASQ